MKKYIATALCVSISLLNSYGRPYFDKSKDILLAQFDLKPDQDDIMAATALGCMLAHPDLEGVNYYAVHGAYGEQEATFYPAPTLYNMAFGPENSNWTDADSDWNTSVTRVKELAKPILNAGGQVWVQEAGQSDFTADWIRLLISEGISESVIKSRVIVVQHSYVNEDMATDADIAYVKSKTNYWHLDDGNNTNNTSPGPSTPAYKSSYTSWMTAAKDSPNLTARSLWIEADRQIQENNYWPTWSVISSGGVDFSDAVEAWWIFELSNAGSVSEFWDKYVTNDNGGNVAPTVSFAIPSSDLSGVPAGSTVSVQANASDSDGSISYVELFIDDMLVDRESIAPYEWGAGDSALENMAAGTYELKLVATDNDGADSAPVYRTVEVGGATSGFEMDQLIAAADFSEESHPADDNIIRDLGTKVGYTRDGAWIRYDNFGFGTGATSIDITLSSGNVGGTVEFRLDSATGTKIGEVTAPGTGGWTTTQDFNATLSSSATGSHTLYLVFKNTNGASGGLVDVWSFTVNSGGTPPVSTKVEAEDATITSGSVKDDPNASAGKYVDGESGFMLQWNVNATGGATDLSFRIKTPWTNTRSMGVFVNNTKVGAVTATAQSWTTETLSGVSLVNGSNTIELRDSEGTYELDVDFLEIQ